MDTVYFKRSSLMHCSAALLCVLFMVSGCRQMAQGPAAGLDPELVELASMEVQEVTAAAEVPVAPQATEGATVPQEDRASGGKSETAAAPALDPASGSSSGSSSKLEPAAAVKPDEGSAVKKVEPANKEKQKVEGGAVEVKSEAALPAERAVAEGSAAPIAETVPKRPASAESIGPETIEMTPIPPAPSEPKTEEKPQELTAIIIGGKEIVLSEPVPVRPVNMLPELKTPGVSFDTMPLAASNPTAVTPPPVAQADDGEGKVSKFRGLLGYGRSAVGYAAEHYVIFGGVGLAAPAVYIFARKKKKFFLRRTLRKMNLED